MKNLALVAVISFVQLAFVSFVWWIVFSTYHGNADHELLTNFVLFGGMGLGVLFMAWKSSTLDGFVMFLSPLVSNHILTERGPALSVALPNILVYSIVVLLIWVAIAVVMKVAFAGVQRIFS